MRRNVPAAELVAAGLLPPNASGATTVRPPPLPRARTAPFLTGLARKQARRLISEARYADSHACARSAARTMLATSTRLAAVCQLMRPVSSVRVEALVILFSIEPAYATRLERNTPSRLH